MHKYAYHGGSMKYNFTDIPEGSPIFLMLHNGNVHTKMEGNIVNLIREDIAIITLETSVNHVLKFDNIEIEVVYISYEGTPYIWKKAKIVHFKNNYVLQIKGEGIRYNRRYTYRVNVSRLATLLANEEEYRITVKDVSLTGFSVADKKNVLNLSIESGATLIFEDLDHNLDLYGSVIRVEERNGYKVYGFIIRRSCRDLPSYITTKLGERGTNIPPSYVI